MKKQARFLSFFMATAVFATSLFTFNLNAKASTGSDPIILPKGGSIVVDDGDEVSLSAVCDNNFTQGDDETNFTYFTSADMKDIIPRTDNDQDETFTVSNSNFYNVTKWVVINSSEDYSIKDGTDIMKHHNIYIYPYSYDISKIQNGYSFESASNSVLTGFDSYSVKVYCGDELLGENKSTGNYRLPTADELKASYSSKLTECGFNFPTATNLYYYCELDDSDDNSCQLKIIIVPTYKISLVYPAIFNATDTSYYVTDNIPVDDNNIKIKPFDGYKYNWSFEEASDYYNSDLQTYVLAFDKDTDLHLNFTYTKPKIKIDTTNKTISGFIPNTIIKQMFNSNNTFTADANGKISYTDDDLDSLSEEDFEIMPPDNVSNIDTCYGFEFTRELIIPMIDKDGDGYKVTNLSDFEGQDVLFSWNGAEPSSNPVYLESEDYDDTLSVTYNENEDGFEKSYDFRISPDQQLLTNSTDNTGIIKEPDDQEYFGTRVSNCGFEYCDGYCNSNYKNNDKVGTATYTAHVVGSSLVAFLKYDFKISQINEFKIDSKNIDKVFHAGSTQKLTTTLKGENLRDNKIAYSVVGNSDPTTKISADGTLTVGENETAEALTVIANYTPMYNKVATITLVNKDLKLQTITHNDTNISVTGLLSCDSNLIIKEIANTDSNYSALLKSAGKGTVLGCYEVTPTGEYDGNQKLSFKVDEKYNGETLNLFHKKSDGTVEKLTGVVENGVVSFTITSFSPFMLATVPVEVPNDNPDGGSTGETTGGTSGGTTESTTDNSTGEVESPKTGTDCPITSTGILLLMSSAVFFISKKSK